MPKYSVKQINRAWHLVNDHKMNIHQVAEIMSCSKREAINTVGEAKRKYDRPIDHFFKKPEPLKKMERPAAVYSNTNFIEKYL